MRRDRFILRRTYHHLKAGYLMIFALIVAVPVAAVLGKIEFAAALTSVVLPIAAFFVGTSYGRMMETVGRRSWETHGLGKEWDDE